MIICTRKLKKFSKGIWVMLAILYLTEEAIAHPQPHPILEFRASLLM